MSNWADYGHDQVMRNPDWRAPRSEKRCNGGRACEPRKMATIHLNMHRLMFASECSAERHEGFAATPFRLDPHRRL